MKTNEELRQEAIDIWESLSDEDRLKRYITSHTSVNQLMDEADRRAEDTLSMALAKSNLVHKVYPCTVIPTRYSGTYEGGQWAAFHCYEQEVPLEAAGSDIECMEWWTENREFVGLGDTPNQAVAHLARLVEAGLRNHPLPYTGKDVAAVYRENERLRAYLYEHCLWVGDQYGGYINKEVQQLLSGDDGN